MSGKTYLAVTLFPQLKLPKPYKIKSLKIKTLNNYINLNAK